MVDASSQSQPQNIESNDVGFMAYFTSLSHQQQAKVCTTSSDLIYPYLSPLLLASGIPETDGDRNEYASMLI